MANSTIGSVTIHGDGSAFITENTARKEAILSPMPLYLNDSENTDIFDFGGVIKTIDLAGKYVGESIAGNRAFIELVEALIQGHQDSAAGYPLIFEDDLRGTLKVKISEFSSTMIDDDGVEQCVWTLKLFEASENA